MSGLTQDRATPARIGEFVSDPVAAATLIHAGALVVLDAAGNAAPGTAATGLTARGIAQIAVDNRNGGAGDQAVHSRTGVFAFDNDDGDPVTRAHIGSDAYIVDDHTVSSDDDSSGRSVAGPVVDVDDEGVWVRVGQ